MPRAVVQPRLASTSLRPGHTGRRQASHGGSLGLERLATEEPFVASLARAGMHGAYSGLALPLKLSVHQTELTLPTALR